MSSATAPGHEDGAGSGCGLKKLEKLRRRPEFLAAARSRRVQAEGFLLQARLRDDTEVPSLIRVGFTCSKKLGNAVARNRSKRRLREVARLVLPTEGRAGWDYVLIGRPGVTAIRDFSLLRADLTKALRRLHA